MRSGLRNRLWDLRWTVFILTLALGAAGLVRPGLFGLALRLWMVALVALLSNAVIRQAAGFDPPVQFTRLTWRSPRPGRRPGPAALAEVERAVLFATWSAFDLRLRLSPLLREVARHRLATRRGIDLDLRPEAAAAALGDELWRLIAPAPGLPRRESPGLSAHAIRNVIETLEAL